MRKKHSLRICYAINLGWLAFCIAVLLFVIFAPPRVPASPTTYVPAPRLPKVPPDFAVLQNASRNVLRPIDPPQTVSQPSAPKVKRIVWPAIQLESTYCANESKLAVFLVKGEKRRGKVGETIDGIEIKNITPVGIELTYLGQTKKFQLDVGKKDLP